MKQERKLLLFHIYNYGMQMYSPVHFLLIFLTVPVFLLGRFFRKEYHTALFYISLALFVSEIIKQYICYKNGIGSLWYFPFQLCSTPMYYFLLHPTKNDSLFNAYEDYLSTYILLGGIMAILYPEDMINRGPFLMVYSFLWHYILIYMASLVFYHRKSEGRFTGSAVIFLAHSAVATLINVALHNYGELNMFYISPYIANTQPVFSLLNRYIGIIPTNALYIFLIIIASSVILKAENRMRK